MTSPFPTRPAGAIVAALVLALAGTAVADDETEARKSGRAARAYLDNLFGGGGRGEEEGAGGGLFSRLKSRLDSALESGRESFDELMDSGSDINAQVEAMLAYLDKKLAGREPAYTQADIDAFAQNVIPLVEELNGRKFDAPPEVKAVGTMQMIQILARDLAPQMEKQMPESSKAMIYARSYLASGIVAPSLLGKYGIEDNTVYVLPENVATVIANAEIAPAHRDEIVQLVIGHELTHKLQDQEINLLDAILAAETADASNAFNATIEGHAVFIENALGTRLGFDEAARSASALLEAGDLGAEAYIYERIAHTRAVQHEQVYLGGERFVAHHHDDGGIERIWRILAAPPQRSSMITQPETYSPDTPPLPDYAARFDFVRAAAGFDEQDWSYEAAAVGDFDLRGAIATVDRTNREAIMRGLTDAAAIALVHNGDFAKELQLGAFAFRTENEAILMVRALTDLTESQIDGIGENPLVELKSRSREAYVGGQAEGVAWQYVTDAWLVGESAATEIVARRGSRVAVYTEIGSGISKEQTAALLQGVMDRLEATE